MPVSGITNGRFWTPAGPVLGDLRIESGRVAAVGPGACREIQDGLLDAHGRDVLPGAIDLHVHVADRQGVHPVADGFLPGSRAAVLGGVTTFLTFATQRPGESVMDCVARMEGEAAAEGSQADWALHVTSITWDEAAWADIARLASRGLRTLKAYTTYRDAGLMVDRGRLRELMKRAKALDLTVLVHCEDQATLDSVAGIRDLGSPRGHCEARPFAAELAAVRDVIALAGATGCSVHVVHASHPGTVGLVVGGREGGVPVTCETCPQYLVMDSTVMDQENAHRVLCTPPFRDPEDRDMLVQMAMSGQVDLLASDHCPFTKADKDSGGGDRRHTPMGLPGVGALVPVAYEMLVEPGAWTFGHLALRTAEVPARLAGLWPRKGAIVVGADADLLVVRTDGEARPVRATLADAYDPWESIETRLSFTAVLLRGEVVVREDRLAEGPPRGRCAWA